MILRATAFGLVLCLLEILALRFAGARFFTSQWAPTIWAFIATPAVSALLMLVALRLLRGAHGDEAEAAAAVAIPILGLGAVALNLYPALFPALDPVLDGVLAAHLMLEALAMLMTGLFLTRLAPQDERV